MPTNEEVLSELQTKFADKIVESNVEYDTLIVELKPESAYEILEYCKSESKSELNFLTTMCGLNIPENGGKELGVMYQVKNLISNYSVRFKAYFPIAEPKIKSVVALFPSANWMERQEYDFFGIEFEGHPDLRRILNVDDMDYFPMRKEYRLEDGTRDDKEDKFFGR
jgi:NADH-quinone oxidoreductase subunit C